MGRDGKGERKGEAICEGGSGVDAGGGTGRGEVWYKKVWRVD